MALTLAESAKLSQDTLVQGVVQTIVSESPILSRLPFMNIVGNGLAYNRESTLPAGAYFAVGATWTEATPTFTQVVTALKILGKDSDVDQFIKKTRSNIQDIEAITLQETAKGVARTFEDSFLYGVAAGTDEFDGLHTLVPSGQTINLSADATPDPMTLTKLDEMIDLVKPGKPDLLLMSRRTRRGLSKYARASSSPITFAPDDLGARAAFYDGIPIGVSDYQLDTETLTAGGVYSSKTGSTGSTVWALKFGEGLLAGLQGTDGIVVELIGALETKDAQRHRVKWYVSLALFNTLAAAALTGVGTADVAA